MEAEGRLYWRCRRGMLELDLLLQSFLRREYEGLDAVQREAFERLLTYPDQQLHEIFFGTASAGEDIADVVDAIRRSAAD